MRLSRKRPLKYPGEFHKLLGGRFCCILNDGSPKKSNKSKLSKETKRLLEILLRTAIK